MIISEIIPIWIMVIICLILLIFISKNKFTAIRQIIMIILIFVINLRIMIISEDVEVMSTNLDVLFVIDNTMSILAEDYGNNNTPRLEAIKNDCNYIIDRLNGSKFSIITFNNNSQILTPYTKDVSLTKDSINMIGTLDKYYAKGSTLNTPLENMQKQLESSKETDKTRKRIVFFISDGEITSEDESLKSFSSIKKLTDDGVVLGYGTENGGYMKVKNMYTETEAYLEDTSNYNYEKAVSKIDEKNLKSIAKDIGIDYIHMESQSKIKDKINEIEKFAKKNINEKSSNYIDTYYILTVPLAILLLYEFINYKRKL